jgi:molybdopterin/thiamine biosynthesis adenylyltransferase
MALRDDQIRRYSRHLLLPELGGLAQNRLAAGAVAIARLDAAGQAAALYLAAAGVGRIVVADGSNVAAPGPLFEADDVGRPCREAAARRVAALNGDSSVVEAAEGAFVIDVAGEGVAAFGAGAAAARRAIRALTGVTS